MNWQAYFEKKEKAARRRLNRNRKISHISPRERARRRNQSSGDRTHYVDPIATELLLMRLQTVPVIVNTKRTNNLPKNGVRFS